MTLQPLVRPAAFVGEWTWSWVGRTVKKNGLKTRSPSTLRSFAAMLSLGDWDLRSIARLTRKLKVCPECLMQESYIPDIWCAEECEVCPEHGWVLQSHCTVCDAGFQLTDALEGQCQCGTPISTDRCMHGTPREVELSRALAWSDPDPSVSQLRRFVCQLLFVLARARRGRDIRFKGLRTGDHMGQWLEMHGLQVRMSIEGVSDLLRSLPTPIHQAAASTWLQGLMTSSPKGQSDFGELPISHWFDTLRSLGAPLSRDRSLGSRLRTPVAAGFVSLEGAARQCGVTVKRLRRWILEGRLTAKAMPQACLGGMMLKLVDVLSCLEADAAQLNYYRSVRALDSGGMNRCMRRQLRICGLFDPAGSIRSLQEMPLGEVLRSITAHALPIEQADVPIVALSDAHWWQWINARAIGQWLIDAHRGLSQVFREPHVQAFQGLHAPATELRRLRHLSDHFFAESKRAKCTMTMDMFGAVSGSGGTCEFT